MFWNSHYKITIVSSSKLEGFCFHEVGERVISILSMWLYLHQASLPSHIKVLQLAPAGTYFHFHFQFHREFYGTFHFILDNLSYLQKKKKEVNKLCPIKELSASPPTEGINQTGALYLMVLKTLSWKRARYPTLVCTDKQKLCQVH